MVRLRYSFQDNHISDPSRPRRSPVWFVTSSRSFQGKISQCHSSAFVCYLQWCDIDNFLPTQPTEIRILCIISSVSNTKHTLACPFKLQIWPLPRDPKLRSYFDPDLFRSACICFDAFRSEELDDSTVISMAHLVQKLFVKPRYFLPKGYFWCLTLEPGPLKWGQVWQNLSEKTLQMLSTVFFRCLLPIIVSNIMAYIRRNMTFRNISPPMTSGYFLIDLNEKRLKKHRLEFLPAIEYCFLHPLLLVPEIKAEGVTSPPPSTHLRHGTSC